MAAGKALNITVGTVNTALLLTSSYSMALAVQAVRTDRGRRAAGFLAATLSLGLLFMGFKAYEYYDDIQRHLVPGLSVGYSGVHPEVARMLYFIYYAMTGLHALHVTIGLGLITTLLIRSLRGEFSRRYYTPVEVSGLYWHFVDVVWIFLYPLLYLMDRHS